MQVKRMTRPWWAVIAALLFCAQFLSAPVFATSSDSGTLTPTQVGNGCYTYVGYYAVQGWGSYSPHALTGGKSVVGIYDQDGCPGASGSSASPRSYLYIGGFTANPGAGWLVSMSCNGVTYQASQANFVFGSIGPAVGLWTWPTLY